MLMEDSSWMGWLLSGGLLRHGLNWLLLRLNRCRPRWNCWLWLHWCYWLWLGLDSRWQVHSSPVVSLCARIDVVLLRLIGYVVSMLVLVWVVIVVMVMVIIAVNFAIAYIMMVIIVLVPELVVAGPLSSEVVVSAWLVCGAERLSLILCSLRFSIISRI